MPRYDYRCDRCGLTEDRIVPVAERDQQTHPCAGGQVLPLPKLFSPPRARPGLDTRARSRWLKQNDLTELGSESPETVAREAARNRKHREAVRQQSLEKQIGADLQDLGDALHTRVPDRKRRRRDPVPADAIGGYAS